MLLREQEEYVRCHSPWDNMGYQGYRDTQGPEVSSTSSPFRNGRIVHPTQASRHTTPIKRQMPMTLTLPFLRWTRVVLACAKTCPPTCSRVRRRQANKAHVLEIRRIQKISNWTRDDIAWPWWCQPSQKNESCHVNSVDTTTEGERDSKSSFHFFFLVRCTALLPFNIENQPTDYAQGM